jgi:hypothetical protein
MNPTPPLRFVHEKAEPAPMGGRLMPVSVRGTIMDALLFIHAFFASFAVLLGSVSRNFSTAVVAGLFVGLVHAGIVALRGAQTGTMPISDLPFVAPALDTALNTGYLTFGNGRYVAFLAGGALALMALTIICFLVRRIACRIVCSLMPKAAT